jgi:predicted RNA-binding Zn-ribbon protein involved in translation (DUF1610 family)
MSDFREDFVKCNSCGVLTKKGQEHTCIKYDPAHPCPECGAPSVYCFAAAPGTGGSYVCQNKHSWGSTVRELTLEEII